MFKTLEHLLLNRPNAHLESGPYADAVKDLQAEGMYELQRLAAKMPDHLLVSCQRRQ